MNHRKSTCLTVRDMHLGGEGLGGGQEVCDPKVGTGLCFRAPTTYRWFFFFTQNKVEPVVKEFLSILDIREEELMTFGSSKE